MPSRPVVRIVAALAPWIGLGEMPSVGHAEESSPVPGSSSPASPASAASPGSRGGPATEAASSEPISSLADRSARDASRAHLTLGGYVEALYQWNFNRPGNGITNYRGYDDRHDTVTLSNAVLEAAGQLGAVTARLALQVGRTPDSEYLSEPTRRGTASVAPTGPSSWRLLQQAIVGWRAPIGRGLLVEAGLYLSPIGPEGLAVKDQWNWSRSNLFFTLPFYHAGLRATYPLGDGGALTLHVCNGWNAVVDNNAEKSLALQYSHTLPGRVTLNLVYMGGVERNPGAAERPWRHLLDAWVAVYPTEALAVLVHADAGFEVATPGTAYWTAGALYGRYRLRPWLYAAVRGDAFFQHVPAWATGADGTPDFVLPVSWVGSGTATLDVRPAENLSVRLEYRHDQAGAPLYFRGAVATDEKTGAYVANATGQDTLTVGATAWF